MKFTIDKEYTTLAQLPKVKQDCKEFKTLYTDNDLLRAFEDAVIDIDIPCGLDILSANLEAFPGGTDYNNETAFRVEIVGRCYHSFFVITFYCDMGLTVDTRDLAFTPGEKLYKVERYKLA